MLKNMLQLFDTYTKNRYLEIYRLKKKSILENFLQSLSFTRESKRLLKIALHQYS